MIVPVILCGGSGTRLWPLSNNDLPKQYISINSNGNTLLEDTISRLSSFDIQPFLVLNRNHPIPPSLSSYINIIYEDYPNDTAIAVTRAALHIQRVYKDAHENITLLVVPSDHYIGNTSQFITDINIGLSKISDTNIVLFGIQPSGPETKYGYIIPSTDRIEFKEKPCVYDASQFIQKGALWNSGIFACNLDTLIMAISRSSYNLYDWVFNPRIGKAPSFDVAILQEHPNIYAHHCENWLWSDVGTWDSFMSIPEIQTEQQRDISSRKTILHSSNSSVLNRSIGNVVVIGCDDLIVVQNGTDLLIMSTKSSNDTLKTIASSL